MSSPSRWFSIAVAVLKLCGGAIKENLVRIIRNAFIQVSHPGLSCHYTSELIVHGGLTIRGPVNIGRRSRLIVPHGSHLVLGGDNYILDDVLIAPGGRMVIGQGSSIQENCILLGCVDIGPYCLLAPRVFVSSGQHTFKGAGKLPAWTMIRLQDFLQPCQGAAISIGSDCWIGINAVLLPGCRLAQGSIVGAGSVLKGWYTKKYCILAGAPAVCVGRRWIDANLQLLPYEDEGHPSLGRAGQDK